MKINAIYILAPTRERGRPTQLTLGLGGIEHPDNLDFYIDEKLHL